MPRLFAASQEPTDSLRLLDDQTYETLDVFKLNVHEMACSIGSLKLSDDSAEYFAVGTAYTLPDELEPSKVSIKRCNWIIWIIFRSWLVFRFVGPHFALASAQREGAADF